MYLPFWALPVCLEGRVPGALFPKHSAQLVVVAIQQPFVSGGERGCFGVSSRGPNRTRPTLPSSTRHLSLSTLPISGPGSVLGEKTGPRLPSGAQEIAALLVSWEAGVPLPAPGLLFCNLFWPGRLALSPWQLKRKLAKALGPDSSAHRLQA